MYGLFTNSYPKKIPRAHGYELSNHSHRMGPCFLEISSLFFAKHWVTALWECIPVGKWRKKTYCRGISPVYLDEIFRLSKVYAFSQNGTNLCHFLGHLISLTKQCLWCQKKHVLRKYNATKAGKTSRLWSGNVAYSKCSS